VRVTRIEAVPGDDGYRFNATLQVNGDTFTVAVDATTLESLPAFRRAVLRQLGRVFSFADFEPAGIAAASWRARVADLLALAGSGADNRH